MKILMDQPHTLNPTGTRTHFYFLVGRGDRATPTEMLQETHEGRGMHRVPLGSPVGGAQVGLEGSGELNTGVGTRGSRHLIAELRVWNVEPK